MSCIQPPALGDDQLLLYLDDNADPGIHDHISTCSYCRAQAAALANFQAQLTAKLYRRGCPSTSGIGRFSAQSDRRGPHAGGKKASPGMLRLHPGIARACR